MLRMNGIEAWISDENKKPFPVYGVQKDPEGGVISCWIPFEPGATFSIRWRDLDDMLDLDIGGFVSMDGCPYGGRLIRSKSYAPAVFSRIPTSPTLSRPLSFPLHSPNHQVRSPLGGTIVLDVHIVSSGETKIYEGLSDYAAKRLLCCSQAPILTSLLPSSSTEVASLGKLATFIFHYRTPNFLRAYGLAPVDLQPSSQQQPSPRVGDKRSATVMGSDDHDDDDIGQGYFYPGSIGYSPASSPTTPSPGHRPSHYSTPYRVSDHRPVRWWFAF
ncbi:hypothetical protein CC2G_007739 [Coprinopsis cinerea AmutBmut pab1-1]|nr:hypothetical protein CC2G_007739 [Coprinopsis cinerea AmutBmut pab1-1]